MLFKNYFLFELVLFKKIFFFKNMLFSQYFLLLLKIVFFKIARNAQNLRFLRGKNNQNVTFCLQNFFKICFLRMIFFSDSCLLKIIFASKSCF